MLSKMARRWTVEEAKTLDLRKKRLSFELENLKPYFKKGIKTPFSLKSEFDFHTYQNSYQVTLNVFLIQVSCRYGGLRFWFLCPRCSGRRMTLHWIPGSDNFYCRSCLNLTYASCQDSTKNPLFKAFRASCKYDALLSQKYLHKNKIKKYEGKLGL